MSRLLTLMQYFLVMLLRGSQDLISSRRGRRRNQHRTRRVCSTAWGSTRRAQTRHRRSRGNFPEWCSERWGASLCLGLARFNTGVHVTSLTKHLVERTQSLRDDQRAVNYVLHQANINWVRETSDDGAAPLLFATSSSIAAGFTRKATVGLLPHNAFVRDCSVDTRGAVVVHCASASHSADTKREALERASAWALRDDWRDVAAGPDASAYLRSLSRTYTVPLGNIYALLKHTIN